MRRECRERFTDMHAWQDHWLAVSFEFGDAENVPDIPGACATHSFTYLARGPWSDDIAWIHISGELPIPRALVGRQEARIYIGTSDKGINYLALISKCKCKYIFDLYMIPNWSDADVYNPSSCKTGLSAGNIYPSAISSRLWLMCDTIALIWIGHGELLARWPLLGCYHSPSERLIHNHLVR